MSIVTPRIVGTSPHVAVQSVGFSTARPSGVESGDYLVMVMRGQSFKTEAQDFTSDGWARISGPIDGTTQERHFGIYGRPVRDVSTEPTTYPWTSTNLGGRTVAVVYAVRGVDLDNPVAGASLGGHKSSTSTATVPAWDVADTALAFWGSGTEYSATSTVAPTSTPAAYPELGFYVSTTSTTVSRTALWVGAGPAQAPSAPEGVLVWPSSTVHASQTVALRGIEEAAQPDPRGEGVAAHLGTGADARVFYSTSSGEVRTPAALVPFLAGFDDVAHMLATPGFTWGHRGNSVRYPEMSRQAYATTAARGYGVLEFSMARTSDGVWFGAHDGTLDRVVGSAVGDPGALTWAQVQELSNVSGQTGVPMPFYRWEDFLADFGDTHVLVLDPKHAMSSYRQDFVDLVVRDCDPDRVILKYFGVGSGSAWLADQARTLGMASWGYFYEADAFDGDLVQWANRWSLIGMDHSASQEAWDVAKSTGIPVVGHIARSQAEYDTAIAKGAVGVQVGATHLVRAVGPFTS